MKYMGSKARIAKYILPIMQQYRKPNQLWVAPFVGGGNMIDKVPGRRLGCDVDSNCISALIAIRDHIKELPKNNSEFTEDMYRALRHIDEAQYKYKGYAGFAFSYGGKWMGGWRRDGIGRRDYVREAYNNAKKQSEKLQGVILTQSSYNCLELHEPSLIYCDPPYEHATKYMTKFDHSMFWAWCREKSMAGHTVFVSEYIAPPDFIPVWEKRITSSLTQNTGAKNAVEKLFIYGGIK